MGISDSSHRLSFHVNFEEVADSADYDHPKEACGVFGVYAPGEAVAMLVFDGLHALQHRGQEAAGIAVSDGNAVTVVKEVGLVTDAFDVNTLRSLDGNLAIGHTRYSTTGGSIWANAQPVYRSVTGIQFAAAHNGNLSNALELASIVGLSDVGASNDSDLIAALLAMELEVVNGVGGIAVALPKVLPRLEGAFSLVVQDDERLIGVRDPNGFRPLCLGRLDSGWVLASETAALDVVGAHFIREIEPGEMVIIDSQGSPRTVRPFEPERVDPKLCLFEFVYIARSDSQLYGRELHGARVRMGRALSRVAPVEADMVIGVPESGLPAAEGYALESGIPYGSGLIRNRYIGRTFITPSQDAREKAVRRKLNVLRENVAGKRLVVIDDSVVRGTTARALSRMLKQAGATEVHMRIVLPPVKWPCFYGVDIGSRLELLSASLSVTELKDLLELDSLSFLALDDLKAAIDAPNAGFCDACITNDYPTKVTLDIGKNVLERIDLTAVH